MFTITNNLNHELIIKKSRFICYLYKVNDLEEINNYLNRIKEVHKNARHHCYAYILDNQKKATDDKEPSGTAGIPMLTLLEQKNLNHVLAIVVRYFGGIKLGTGGLFRAYTGVLKETIDLANIEEEIIKYKYKIELDLNKANILDKLQNIEIKNKVFSDIISVELIAKDDIDEYLSNLNIKIIDKEKYI
ncbi:MAG: YigZ family protein [Bacilli bacterium]|nr:YigZ family protein [Bacilli bacterium]